MQLFLTGNTPFEKCQRRVLDFNESFSQFAYLNNWVVLLKKAQKADPTAPEIDESVKIFFELVKTWPAVGES